MAVEVENFIAELSRAAESLADDANGYAREAADKTASAIRAIYQQHRSPTDTYIGRGGRRLTRKHLADNVIVTRLVTTQRAGYRVVVDAPHAHLFERGTDSRTWKTRGGKSTGTMRGEDVLIPEAQANRRSMRESVKASLRDAGFDVADNG